MYRAEAVFAELLPQEPTKRRHLDPAPALGHEDTSDYVVEWQLLPLEDATDPGKAEGVEHEADGMLPGLVS